MTGCLPRTNATLWFGGRGAVVTRSSQAGGRNATHCGSPSFTWWLFSCCLPRAGSICHSRICVMVWTCVSWCISVCDLSISVLCLCVCVSFQFTLSLSPCIVLVMSLYSLLFSHFDLNPFLALSPSSLSFTLLSLFLFSFYLSLSLSHTNTHGVSAVFICIPWFFFLTNTHMHKKLDKEK